jgi:hypothetical protein
MDQAIKDTIAASNEAIRILLQADDTPPGPERDQLMDAAMGEIEEAIFLEPSDDFPKDHKRLTC